MKFQHGKLEILVEQFHFIRPIKLHYLRGTQKITSFPDRKSVTVIHSYKYRSLLLVNYFLTDQLVNVKEKVQSLNVPRQMNE